MTLDLLFPVLGDSLPTDHGYLLFAAASHLAPVFHDPKTSVRSAAINGTYAGGGRILLGKFSRWRVRLPDERIHRLKWINEETGALNAFWRHCVILFNQDYITLSLCSTPEGLHYIEGFTILFVNHIFGMPLFFFFFRLQMSFVVPLIHVEINADEGKCDVVRREKARDLGGGGVRIDMEELGKLAAAKS